MLFDATSFAEVMKIITGFIALMLASLTSFAVFFAAFTTWYGFKYRRDTNLNLRKETHINIAETYDKFIKNIDNKEVMEQEYYDLKLLGYFSSPLGIKRKGLKLNLHKNNTKLRNSLINQFKNWETIENDFYIKRKLPFNKFALEMGLIEKPITDRNELIKILTLLNIFVLTDSSNMIKNTNDYEHVIRFILSFNSISTKRLKKYTKKLSRMSKEQKTAELNKIKNEIENIGEEMNSEISNTDENSLDENLFLSLSEGNDIDSKATPTQLNKEETKVKKQISHSDAGEAAGEPKADEVKNEEPKNTD